MNDTLEAATYCNTIIGQIGASQAKVELPRIKAVRIINTKNGYLIMPDNGYGNVMPFDDAYVAKDLDEVKEALARHYVEQRLA